MERKCKHPNKYYVCKRLRMLEFLKNKGFLPELTLPDANNPRYNIWKFLNSPELEDAVDEYLAQFRK